MQGASKNRHDGGATPAKGAKNGMIQLVISLFLLSPVSLRGEAALSTFLSEIEATYRKMEDLQADFTQTIRFEGFDTESVESGRLFLKKGLIRWDYQKPEPKQIFVNGNRVFYYTPEQQQVIKRDIAPGDTDQMIPLQLLTKLDHLGDYFRISVEEAGVNRPTSIRMIPHTQGGSLALRYIIATVVPYPKLNGLILKTISLYEENGNVSTFSFDGVKVNQGIKEGQFQFKIPKGVEVIEDR